VRRVYLIGIAVGAILFLAISALLARAFSADGAERSAVTALVQAEARGDVGGMLNAMHGCREMVGCRQRVAEDAASLKRRGTVSILQLQSSTGFSLTSTLGYARVAWNAGGSLPAVQCVHVHRAGDVLSGLHIELLAISPKLKGDATCP
jgi:hypothetical protein